MADLKISQLTGATTPLAGTEVVPLVQSSTTKKVAVSDLTAGRAVSMASATISGDLTVDTDTLKVDSTNNRVGLGTTTPNSILDIVANTNTVRIGRSTTSYSTIDSNSSAGSLSLTADAGGLLGGGTMRLYVSTVECIKLDSAGNITATTGNIIQGTAAKGINFTANTPAANMTSQLLNWYEEGTFDPRLSFATGGDTCSYSGRTGRYTRVGRLVTVNLYIGLTAKGAGTGNVTLINLPFTAGSYSSAVPRVVNVSSTGTISAYIYSGQSVFTFFSVSTAGTETQLTDTNITNSTEMVLTLSYIV